MRHKAVLEKNRKFLDKNIELTKENRNVKDSVRDLTEENFKLVGEQLKPYVKA